MKYRINTSNERVWCTTQLATLSFNHSVVLTADVFQLFIKLKSTGTFRGQARTSYNNIKVEKRQLWSTTDWMAEKPNWSQAIPCADGNWCVASTYTGSIPPILGQPRQGLQMTRWPQNINRGNSFKGRSPSDPVRTDTVNANARHVTLHTKRFTLRVLRVRSWWLQLLLLLHVLP